MKKGITLLYPMLLVNVINALLAVLIHDRLSYILVQTYICVFSKYTSNKSYNTFRFHSNHKKVNNRIENNTFIISLVVSFAYIALINTTCAFLSDIISCSLKLFSQSYGFFIISFTNSVLLPICLDIIFKKILRTNLH